MLDALALFLCLGAATVGGVFFTFSTFVIKALASLPASQGIAAMQRINVVVLNPLFGGVFVGTALLSLGSGVAAGLSWTGSGSPWLLSAGVLYFVGSLVVTGAFNVPRNEKLAELKAESAEASAYWPTYLREWMRWNHVRTVASLASAACAAMFLAR